MFSNGVSLILFPALLNACWLGDVPLNSLSSFPLEYGEWQLFDYTIEVPAIADYFVFEIHSYAGTKMYVDDCWVVDIDMYK